MDLFSPIFLGDLHLANRVVMAPLTRVRSGADGVPTALVAEYYAQRASVGLIISEGVCPGKESRGYFGQPGIVTDEQEAAWKVVADAVHEAGGEIVMQLMHSGRVSHPDLSGTDRTVAPSAVAIDGEVHTHGGIYLAYDEGRRFVSTDAIQGDFEPHEPFMIGIWEIAPEGVGTRYTARARHWTEDAKRRHEEMGFAEGWGVCADQLKALCEGT